MSTESERASAKVLVGARVDCTDGTYGALDAVVVNPLTRIVTHYVVRDDLDKLGDRIVPAELCIDATPAVLRLNCTVDEVRRAPQFNESAVVALEAGQHGFNRSDVYVEPFLALDVVNARGDHTIAVENVPPGTLVLDRGMFVDATDGTVGKLGELVVDLASGAITHFTLERTQGLRQLEVTLPVSAIDYIIGHTAQLKLDRNEVEMLPASPVRRPVLDFSGFERVEFVAKIFDSLDGAREALGFLEEGQRHNPGTFKIREAAVLECDATGKVSVRDRADVTEGRGAVVGAVLGGVVGLAAGPFGLLLGAVTGVRLGAVIGPRIDLGFSDAFLAKLNGLLEPGRSALLVQLEHDWDDVSHAALGAFEAIIPQQHIIDTVVQDLVAARTPA